MVAPKKAKSSAVYMRCGSRKLNSWADLSRWIVLPDRGPAAVVGAGGGAVVTSGAVASGAVAVEVVEGDGFGEQADTSRMEAIVAVATGPKRRSLMATARPRAASGRPQPPQHTVSLKWLAILQLLPPRLVVGQRTL